MKSILYFFLIVIGFRHLDIQNLTNFLREQKVKFIIIHKQTSSLLVS